LQFAVEGQAEEIMRAHEGGDFIAHAAAKERAIGYRNALLRVMALPRDWEEDLKRLYMQKVEEDESQSG
jgi:hypothetical protein